ncbi:selenium cofactor biosynthesis protein YqeC [Ilumatobacteraceae bacterium]|nr:selenium cofactor biosynthesis protein YqeC [Ilumatobacteraceae bacterium]
MNQPVTLEQLGESLGLAPREQIAVVGGGGKSTTVLALGRQLPGRVILTTTTKMGARQTAGFPVLEAPSQDSLRAALDSGTVMVRSKVQGSKALGVTPECCDEWFADPTLSNYVVIEADGARTRPFKAPAPHEPVIPQTATVVLSVIGADALGRVIADQCQRPMRVAALAGCSPYERLTPARAGAVLLHERGGARNVPDRARRVVLITKVPNPEVDPDTRELADALRHELARHVEVIAVGWREAD